MECLYMNDVEKFKILVEKFNRMVIPKKKYEPSYLEICDYPWRRLEEICSRMFAFFFNSKNPHGLETLFFDTLVEVYQEKYFDEMNRIGAPRFKNTHCVEVEVEVITEKSNRIDLLLTTDSLKICIENKIDAPPDNNFDDYFSYVKKESEHFDLHAVCILFALCEKAEYENVNPNFKTIYYREFLEKLKRNLGFYVTQSNAKYIAILTDFILFLDRTGGYMSDLSEEERKFFIDNDKELSELVERREKFLLEQKKLLEQRIEIIRSSLNEKEHESLSGDWWSGGLYLGGHFRKDDNQYELGIEAGFAKPMAKEFDVSISIWKWGNQNGRIRLYKPKLAEAFKILKEDKTSGKWCVMIKKLDMCDNEKIVSELYDVYKKVEEIVNQVKNQK